MQRQRQRQLQEMEQGLKQMQDLGTRVYIHESNAKKLLTISNQEAREKHEKLETLYLTRLGELLHMIKQDEAEIKRLYFQIKIQTP